MARSLDLVLLHAGPGFGKTTALEAARPRDGVLLTAREALDALAGASSGGERTSWVGVDDLHELAPAQQLELLTELVGQPSVSRLVLTSRQALPEEARRLPLRVRTRGPAELSLTPYDVRRVLVDEYGVTDPEAPVEIHRLTAGWLGVG